MVSWNLHRRSYAHHVSTMYYRNLAGFHWTVFCVCDCVCVCLNSAQRGHSSTNLQDFWVLSQMRLNFERTYTRIQCVHIWHRKDNYMCAHTRHTNKKKNVDVFFRGCVADLDSWSVTEKICPYIPLHIYNVRTRKRFECLVCKYESSNTRYSQTNPRHVIGVCMYIILYADHFVCRDVVVLNTFRVFVVFLSLCIYANLYKHALPYALRFIYVFTYSPYEYGFIYSPYEFMCCRNVHMFESRDCTRIFAEIAVCDRCMIDV